MTVDKPSIADDDFADRLAAIDDAFASCRSPTVAPDATPDLRDRLARGVAALRDLQHLRPPRTRSPGSGVRSKEAGVRGQEESLLTADSCPLTPGSAARIGRFTVIRELGRGGFGVVFLAHDPTLHRDVALKVPHARALIDAALRDRFRREGLAAAGLDHPNLVPVYEVDDVGPVCYIASGYVPGPSLAEWLSRRAVVSAIEAAAFVATLAEAVAHAHSRGVLHRDLKPANVLLIQKPENRNPKSEPDPGSVSDFVFRISDFTPKVCDFGLARIAADPERVTRTGASLGTPGYMAPEQAIGAKDAGPAVDVYALGAILYEILTGRPPFRGEADLDTLRQAAECDPVAPRHLRPSLPRDLDTVCLKCLEKNPAKRYASASALAEDLQRFVAGKPVLARRVGRIGRAARWCRRKPVVAGLAAALVLAVLTGGAAVWRQYRRAERERDVAVVERDRGRRLLGQVHAALGRLHDLGQDQHSIEHIFGSGRGDDARSAYRRAEDLVGELGGDGAATAEDHHYRLVMALDQARLDIGVVGWETTVRSMTAIIARQRAALAAYPNDRALALDLAMALDWLNAAHCEGGQWADAEKYCREGFALRRRLLDDQPDNVEARMGLALSWSRLGRTLAVAGRATEAEAPYLEACRAYDRLIADAPNDPIARHDYAKHLLDGWRLYEKLNRPAEIAKLFRTLVALRTQLVRLQPQSARRKTELAWAHFHLGRQSWVLGDLATARKEYAAARQMLAVEAPADQAADFRRLAETLADFAPRLDPEKEPAQK